MRECSGMCGIGADTGRWKHDEWWALKKKRIRTPATTTAVKCGFLATRRWECKRSHFPIFHDKRWRRRRRQRLQYGLSSGETSYANRVDSIVFFFCGGKMVRTKGKVLHVKLFCLLLRRKAYPRWHSFFKTILVPLKLHTCGRFLKHTCLLVFKPPAIMQCLIKTYPY